MPLRHRIGLLFFISLLVFQATTADDRWWVFFRDKGPSVALPHPSTISDRARFRRARSLSSKLVMDYTDVPVHSAYVRALGHAGAHVRVVSRWLNAVSIEADLEILEFIRTLPFVASTQPVRSTRKRPEPMLPTQTSTLLKKNVTTSLSYGESFDQNQTLNAIALHELGIIGRGVLVGMVDDGYNFFQIHPSLSPIRVVAEYDFVQGDSSVSFVVGEPASQGFHGTATLSVLGGFHPDFLIGPAYGAEFALAKTEVSGSETLITEEDNYVRGLEWLEALGVDIISSSLGYFDADTSTYTYSQLNGATATTTKAARILAAKGVLLVTAMGNEGNYQLGGSVTGTLIAPADADSILSVGAINSTGQLTRFSSTGPTADGRIKPEVVAQGSNVYVANGVPLSDGSMPSNYYYRSNGTSFSTPFTAAAAALVLSAHPDATAMQLRDAIRNTAVRDQIDKTAIYPNNFYGWGRVDAYAAALSLGPVMSNMPIVRYAVVGTEPSLLVTVRAASSSTLDMARFALHARRTADTAFVRYPLTAGTESGIYTARIPLAGPADTSYVGYLTIADQSGPELRRPTGSGVFQLHPTPDSLASLFPPVDGGGVPETFSLRQNYPNPFNAGTTIIFQAPRRERVELAVYNLLGQKVATLFSGLSTPGSNAISWSRATDAAGRDLPSGIYLFRLSTTDGQHIRKMMLLK